MLSSFIFSQPVLLLEKSGSRTVISFPDIDPDPFVFADVTDAELGTDYTDSTIISGLDSALISITGGTYKIGLSGSYVSTDGMVYDGDTVWVKGTSSLEYLTAVDVTPIIGTVSDVFTITTKSNPGGDPPAGTEQFLAFGDVVFLTNNSDTLYVREQ